MTQKPAQEQDGLELDAEVLRDLTPEEQNQSDVRGGVAGNGIDSTSPRCS
jgi:hypothetical protein